MSYLLFFNVLKINLLNNKKYFYYNFNKKNKQLLKKFIEINIIKCVYWDKQKGVYKIYINYKNNEPLYSNIKLLYKVSNPLYVNLKTLTKIKKYKTNSIFILFTNKGLITNFEAIDYKVGGILFCKILL